MFCYKHQAKTYMNVGFALKNVYCCITSLLHVVPGYVTVLRFEPGVHKLFAEVDILYDNVEETRESFVVHLSEDTLGLAVVKVSLL